MHIASERIPSVSRLLVFVGKAEIEEGLVPD
jgi:hypothetical protein